MKSNGKTAHEAVRIEAYLLSEKAGHPPGMDDYFWTEAELIVAARASEKAAPKRLAAKAKPKAKAVAAPAAKKAPSKKKA